jgi:putative FmdB family regulatory protein
MPMYAYECKDCGREFEVLIGVGEGEAEAGAEIRCDKCGSTNVERTFSAFNISSGGRSSSSPICPTGTCPTGTCDLG